MNEKLKNAGQNDFLFDQKTKLTIKFISNLSHLNLCYYLKFAIPIMHRQYLEFCLKITKM